MTAVIFWVFFSVVTLLSSLLTAAYIYSTYVFDYFKGRGLRFEPATFPFGNLSSVFSMKKSYNEVLFDLYNKYKGQRLIGFFQFFKRSVLIIDTELVRQVLVKDYEYFDGKNIHYDKDREPLTATLFALEGQEWKTLRAKMSPVFSSGKLKGMFDTVVNVGHSLRDYMIKLKADNDELECKDLFIRYGLAIIASTAFGIDSDVLTDKSSMFFRMSHAITSPTVEMMFRNGLLIYGTEIAKALRIRVIPKQIHDFFMGLVTEVVEHREKQGETRNDFMQLMVQLKQESKVGDQEFTISLNEIAAQSYVFILAGFETTSNTMSFFLYEMALNPEVQRRVLKEVDAAEEVTYETVADMEYLDMAIDETLRKYASVGFLSRVCSKDYQVPGTEQVIEKGTQVVISVHGMHKDPDLFPEPERFIPERFSKENKGNITPYSYMPFGEGPRFCIGMRFAKLSIKAGLAVLLRQFEVQTTANTPIPLKFQTKTVTTTAEGGMYLRFVERHPRP